MNIVFSRGLRGGRVSWRADNCLTVLTGVSSAIFFIPGFLLFIPGGKLIIALI